MGIAIIALANQKNMDRGTAVQTWFTERLTSVFLRIQEWASPVPEVLQALLLFVVVAGLVAATLTGRRRGVVARAPKDDDPAVASNTAPGAVVGDAATSDPTSSRTAS